MNLIEKINLMIVSLDLRISSLEKQRVKCWENYPEEVSFFRTYPRNEFEFQQFTRACNLSGEIDGLRSVRRQLAEIIKSNESGCGDEQYY